MSDWYSMTVADDISLWECRDCHFLTEEYYMQKRHRIRFPHHRMSVRGPDPGGHFKCWICGRGFHNFNFWADHEPQCLEALWSIDPVGRRLRGGSFWYGHLPDMESQERHMFDREPRFVRHYGKLGGSGVSGGQVNRRAGDPKPRTERKEPIVVKGKPYEEFISILMNEHAFVEACKRANIPPTRRQCRKFAQKRGAAHIAYELIREENASHVIT